MLARGKSTIHLLLNLRFNLIAALNLDFLSSSNESLLELDCLLRVVTIITIHFLLKDYILRLGVPCFGTGSLNI